MQIDDNVFMQLPPGHMKYRKIIMLNRAKVVDHMAEEIGETLQHIGFQPIPHKTYCLIIFFYIDDIILAFQHDGKTRALGLIDQLQRRFKLSGNEELELLVLMDWSHQDHKQQLIWLSQSAYIDRIANLIDTKQSDKMPMHGEELPPYEQRGLNMLSAITGRKSVPYYTLLLSREQT